MIKQTKEERQQILAIYQEIVNSCKKCRSDNYKKLIHKAFNFLNETHKNDRRITGVPAIFHPVEVAKIVASELGLGPNSVISALLHDILIETEYTKEDIKNLFGEKIAVIVEGISKLTEAVRNDQNMQIPELDMVNDTILLEDTSSHAENFRKLLLTLCDDSRIFLIKLADRIANMRHADSVDSTTRMKLCRQTMLLYAPLAHRLGLYKIKSELENLCLKIRHPEIYLDLQQKIKYNEQKRIEILKIFIKPIEDALRERDVSFHIDSRPKSIYSTWNKMQRKGVSFKEVYDLLAIRIIFQPFDSYREKEECWEIYSVITAIYIPKFERIRDWVSAPKSNGYEALHVTVQDKSGHWIEVQIRSKRMNDIAENGIAAHWKYKGVTGRENQFDEIMKKVRDRLEDPFLDQLDLLDDLRLTFLSNDILIYTPKGHLRKLPKNATVLDFAFEIHSELGYHCIGAKVNHETVPIHHTLKSGDHVRILTLKNQKPKPEWLEMVKTKKAKTALKNAFKLQRKEFIVKGKDILEQKLNKIGRKPNSNIFRKLYKAKEINNKDDLYFKIGAGIISEAELENILKKRSQNKFIKYWKLQFAKLNNGTKKKIIDDEAEKLTAKSVLVAKDHIPSNHKKSIFKMAECCMPAPGDDVEGVRFQDKIVIHKKNCPKLADIKKIDTDSVVAVEWKQEKVQASLACLKLSGTDRNGVIHNITGVIMRDLNVKLRAINIENHDDIFNGKIDLYIENKDNFHHLITKLKSLEGVKNVRPVEVSNKNS